MVRRLFTSLIILAFLGATSVRMAPDVLCLMTMSQQSSCCCHKAKEKEEDDPRDAVQRPCCEVQPTVVATATPAIHDGQSVFPSTAVVLPTSTDFSLQTIAAVDTLRPTPATERGPPRAVPRYILHCSYLI